MQINAVPTNQSQLANLLQRIAANQANLTKNLMQVSVQNTINLNKLQNIASVVDLYA